MCSTPWATVDGVAFLASWLRLPADVLELFLETWTVTRYGQVALSVMGFGFATTLVPLVYFGKLRLRKIRLSGVLAASVGLFAIVAWGGTQLRPFLLPVPSNALLPLTLDPTLVRTVNVTLERDPLRDGSPAPAGRDPTLLAIQKSGERAKHNPRGCSFRFTTKAARWECEGFHTRARLNGVCLYLPPGQSGERRWCRPP